MFPHPEADGNNQSGAINRKGMKMISKLFAKLYQINCDMEQAISTDDVDRVNELDSQYIELWDEILCYQPASVDEAKTMVLHLLTHFADRAEHGEDIKNIRMKILELFGKPHWHQDPMQAYGT